MTSNLVATTAPHDGLLSENEAIEYLGLYDRPNPKGSLRWLMRTGKIAYVKLARGIHAFDKEDLDAYVASCRIPAGRRHR